MEMAGGWEMSELEGIATIYKVRKKFRLARILFDGKFIPVDYYQHAASKEEMVAHLGMDFPFIRVVKNKVFECELDHIKLFNCRSDAPSFELPPDTAENRLTNEQIQRILGDSEKLLNSINTDKLEKEYHALLSGRAVEDPTQRS